jgi:hypothetical protein
LVQEKVKAVVDVPADPLDLSVKARVPGGKLQQIERSEDAHVRIVVQSGHGEATPLDSFAPLGAHLSGEELGVLAGHAQPTKIVAAPVRSYTNLSN